MCGFNPDHKNDLRVQSTCTGLRVTCVLIVMKFLSFFFHQWTSDIMIIETMAANKMADLDILSRKHRPVLNKENCLFHSDSYF